MTRTLLAALAMLSLVGSLTPTLAEGPSNLSAPQDLQIGLFGDFSIDAGDVSLYSAGNVDWVVWKAFTLHYGLSFEQRLNSFVRGKNALGIGYLLQRERYSAPIWVAPGIATTGLWSHYLNRGFFSVGAGYRLHLGARAGAGVNGLVFSGDADSSEIRGLMVNRFTVDGINILGGADGITLADN